MTRPGHAHFVRTDADRYVPASDEAVRSDWSDDRLLGGAVVGLAAFAVEESVGHPDYLPARFTVDLFKTARKVATTARVDLLRDGRRVRNAVCVLEQEGAPVARAILVQYRPGEAPRGHEWASAPDLPAPAGADDAFVQFHSEDVGWNSEIAEHQNTSRKTVIIRSMNVVAGESNSPFVRAATAAEAASMVTNLGTAGLGYINGDLTAGFARMPQGDWVGVHAESHWTADGIAVGTATLSDTVGAFGSALVTAVSNAMQQIDYSNRDANRG
ncbi:MAG: acyl-CoA thioesterase domain-containing protein [Actinomycetota bacterium]